jgi:type I restriction enzyme, S subunit
MKKGWRLIKLGDLSKNKDAVVSGPFGSNLKVSDYKDAGVPILRLQNIGKGYFIDKDIKYITNEKAQELKYHSFVSGDIALAKLGIPVGKTCIIPPSFSNGIIVADVVRIRPDKSVVSYKFLEYYLNTDFSVAQLTGNITGATRPRVNLSDVRNIEIPLPSFPEQQGIVAILDEAFAVIAKAKATAEKNLQNAKELFESYLQGVFENKEEDWEESKLGKVIILISGQHIDSKNYNTEGKGIGYLTGPSDFGPFNPIISKWTEYPKVKASKGDILITVKGSGVGKINLLDKDNIAISRQIMAIRVTGAEPQYVYLLLNSAFDHFQDQATGAAIPGLSRDQILSLIINLPPLSKQQGIVHHMHALQAQTQKLELIYQQKIAALEELKKSILEKAFKGELVREKEMEGVLED